jgi:hypothetical protein
VIDIQGDKAKELSYRLAGMMEGESHLTALAALCMCLMYIINSGETDIDKQDLYESVLGSLAAGMRAMREPE